MSNQNTPQGAVNALAKKNPNANSLHEYLKAQGMNAIQKVAAKHLNPERVLQIGWNAIRGNQMLLKCEKTSLLTGIIEATQLGLQVDGVLGHAYLVPRRNKGVWEAQMQIGYRGLINLAHRGGAVLGVEARVVKAGDPFSYGFGTESYLRHSKSESGRGEVTHAYCIITLKDGAKDFEVWTREEINANMKRSQSAKSGYSPWATDFDEMARKGVTRNKLKYVPMESEALHAVVRDEYRDFGVAGAERAQVVEVEAAMSGAKAGAS